MLARTVFPVLRLRLAPSVQVVRASLKLSPLVRTTIGSSCHELYRRWILFFSFLTFFSANASPQIDRTPPPGAPPANFYDLEAVTMEVDGPLRKLRGAARIQTTEMVLYADEVDYNTNTNYAEARGNVHF